MRRLWLLPVLALAAWSSPLSAAAQDIAAEPLPSPGVLLEEGRYVSEAVGPRIEFRADDGWLTGPSGGGPIFILERTELPGSFFSVTRFDGETFLDSCDPSSMTVVDPSVERLAEIIAGNPYLVAGPPTPVEVDGYRGVAIDVGVPAYTECSLPFLLIWAVPVGSGGEFLQVADQQSRFILLDVDGDAIVIAIETYPGVPFGALLEASLELVDSMRIEPGEYVPPEPTPSPEATAEPSQGPSPEDSPSPPPLAAGGASA